MKEFFIRLLVRLGLTIDALARTTDTTPLHEDPTAAPLESAPDPIEAPTAPVEIPEGPTTDATLTPTADALSDTVATDEADPATVPPIDVVDVVVPTPSQPRDWYFDQLDRVIRHNFQPDWKTRYERLYAGYVIDHPGDASEQAWQKRLGLAKSLTKALNDLYHHARNREDAATRECQQKLDEAGRFWSGQAKRQLEAGIKAQGRVTETNSRKKSGHEISRIKPPANASQTNKTRVPKAKPTRVSIADATPAGMHPRDVRALQPGNRWTILMDETGSVFDDSAEHLKTNDVTLGRMVALLLPDDHGLEPLKKNWHARDESLDAIEKTFQAVLDAPVGVLGFDVTQMAVTAMDRWPMAVVTMLDLVLRLLPLDGPTHLSFLVENRQPFDAGADWRGLVSDALRRLSLTHPERARLIRCDLQFIAKTGSALNGYVDVLAFVWGSPAEHSRCSLDQSGLLGTCFLTTAAGSVVTALDWLDRGRLMLPADWAALLASPDAKQPASLTATVLERLGETARLDGGAWRRYLLYVLEYMRGKAIDVRRLGQLIDWLDRWAPAGETLPPTVRLLWLTARVARANHVGDTEQAWVAELRQLGDTLLDEDARLVALADMNIAVSFTNRFDFTGASASLARWHDQPVAAMGLRYHGQWWSSRGQHAAFDGRHAEAVECFDRAIASFMRLSDPVDSLRERNQTGVYRAIALMDDPDVSDDSVYEAIADVFELLDKTPASLASSGGAADHYMHHLLLRALVQRPQPDMIAAYLATEPRWKVGHGHPWPLIQTYRALLLGADAPDRAQALLLTASDIANGPGQGPVVRLIGAVAQAIAAHRGVSWPEATEVLDGLAGALPLAAERVDMIREFVAHGGDERQLLRAVLPFNFR